MSNPRINIVPSALLLLFAMTIAVNANSPPSIIIDHARTLNQPHFVHNPVYVSVEAFDPDGDAVIQWQWRILRSPYGDTPLLNNAGASQICFHPNHPGDYVLSVCAGDGSCWSRSATVIVHVYEQRSARQSLRSASLSGAASQSIRIRSGDDRFANRLMYRIYRFYVFLLQLVGLIDAR